MVRARARFFSFYADAAVADPPFDVRDLALLVRQGPIRAAERRVVNLMRDDGAARLLRRELEQMGRAQPRETWIRTGEVADALRQCAIAELLLDTTTGRESLLRAAYRYQDLGLPFGLFLIAAATGSHDSATNARDQLRDLLEAQTSPIAPGDEDVPEPDLPTHRRTPPAAVQLVYLLLTVAAEPLFADAGHRWLRSAVTAYGPPLRSTPVGTTSQPFDTWWEAGRQLAELASENPEATNSEARSSLRSSISELAYAHGRQLRSAQFDEYHWRSGRARVDLIDLDLAGLVALSARSLRWRQLPGWNLREDFAGLSPLAQVSLATGIALGSDGEDSADDFDEPPHPTPSSRRDATDETTRWNR